MKTVTYFPHMQSSFSLSDGEQIHVSFFIFKNWRSNSLHMLLSDQFHVPKSLSTKRSSWVSWKHLTTYFYVFSFTSRWLKWNLNCLKLESRFHLFLRLNLNQFQWKKEQKAIKLCQQKKNANMKFHDVEEVKNPNWKFYNRSRGCFLSQSYVLFLEFFGQLNHSTQNQYQNPTWAITNLPSHKLGNRKVHRLATIKSDRIATTTY